MMNSYRYINRWMQGSKVEVLCNDKDDCVVVVIDDSEISSTKLLDDVQVMFEGLNKFPQGNPEWL